ncbi:hypothetical protein BG015_010825 [Linnemannia schmuckeri]|uniref:Methyltransferase domain-containing protein n=1 Tax=Linnemannia schmuckeri TaxID=64567 RepID=A0A9P5RW83_9FUNG|nr:hypothetical protein BG015_010825 [Linnemannia schmuckeri]
MDQVGNQLAPGKKHDRQDKEGSYNHDPKQEREQAQDQEQKQEEQEEKEEYDRYKNNPELLGETKTKATRMFSYDWASGYVSPFRPTPCDILSNMLQHVDFPTAEINGSSAILDLGCGDGLVLVQALETFPRSQLSRAIGVDLDRPLLEAARDRIQQEHPSSPSTSGDSDERDILSRLEMYHGDLTAMHVPLTTIMAPHSRQSATATTEPKPATMDTLINQSSHLFVYLLPVALSKLAPLLLDAIVTKHKVVLSMRWEIPELSDFLIHGGERHQFYIYQATTQS